MRTGLALLYCVLLVLPARAQEEDCRIRPEDFKPLIARFNPFFTDHEWQPTARLEIARMAGGRLLLINQEGCTRYFVTFTVVLDPREVQSSPVFWANEFKTLLYKVFYQNPDYDLFRTEYERQIDEKLSQTGFNQPFNFPIGSRNFIGEVQWSPDKRPAVVLKMVEYIFKEKVMQPRRETGPDTDDGWFGIERDQP